MFTRSPVGAGHDAQGLHRCPRTSAATTNELDASLRAFDREDARRECSRERDIGLHWQTRDGGSYRAAWAADTGESNLVRHGDSAADDRLTVLARLDASTDPETTRDDDPSSHRGVRSFLPAEMITELACKLDRAPDPPTAVPAKRPRR